MAEQMNAGMEKVFLNYILDNPLYFAKVDETWFKIEDIRDIYSAIKKEYIVSKEIPTDEQIIAMVKLSDVENRIQIPIIKAVLKNDAKFGKEWLDKHFRAWKLAKETRNKIDLSVDCIRNIEEINYDNVKEISTKIRNLFADLDSCDIDENDLGDDFDDYESHLMKTNSRFISTGWQTLDTLLKGGWSPGTMVVFMAETSGGKCICGNTPILIKNKNNEFAEETTIKEFFEKIK